MDVVRVALDGTPLLGPRTGVGEVVAGLLGALAHRDDVEPCAYAVTRRGRDQLPPVLPPGVRAATSPFPARAAHALWGRAPLPHIERWTGPVDVVHATNFVAPPARAPVVLTIHDLTFLRYPELCTPASLRYPAAIRRALARGAVVHAPSDYVADEVREAFGLRAERIVRIYSGLPPTTGGDPAAGRARVGADRYVLALGTVEPRKNFAALVRAFDEVAADDTDLHLAIAGPDGWDRERVMTACSVARAADRIHRLGYVPAADRSALLAGATAFAYPSVYEGFGFPPLEAMAAGVPVLASTAGALPEVLGDAACLVDPLDLTAIAAGLAAVVGDPTLRTTLTGRGHTRVSRYRWTTAAAEAATLYRRLRA